MTMFSACEPYVSKEEEYEIYSTHSGAAWLVRLNRDPEWPKVFASPEAAKRYVKWRVAFETERVQNSWKYGIFY